MRPAGVAQSEIGGGGAETQGAVGVQQIASVDGQVARVAETGDGQQQIARPDGAQGEISGDGRRGSQSEIAPGRDGRGGSSGEAGQGESVALHHSQVAGAGDVGHQGREAGIPGLRGAGSPQGDIGVDRPERQVGIPIAQPVRHRRQIPGHIETRCR